MQDKWSSPQIGCREGMFVLYCTLRRRCIVTMTVWYRHPPKFAEKRTAFLPQRAAQPALALHPPFSAPLFPHTHIVFQAALWAGETCIVFECIHIENAPSADLTLFQLCIFQWQTHRGYFSNHFCVLFGNLDRKYIRRSFRSVLLWVNLSHPGKSALPYTPTTRHPTYPTETTSIPAACKE